MCKLDTIAMLKAIDELVNTDFCEDMSLHTMPNSKPYTQEEAHEMAAIIGRVYLISHAVHCTACRRRWIITMAAPPQPEKGEL
jgi:hypothetical protein